MPVPGVGGNGTASEFGDLSEMTRQEADDFLRGLGAQVKISAGDYIEYKFVDRSKITIRADGEVVRTPAPRYDTDGARINRGLRLDKNGALLLTRDQFGNFIPGTHNTQERLRD